MSLIYGLLGMFILINTGCTVQPERVVVIEKEVKVITIDEKLTSYIEIDKSSVDEIDTSTKDSTITSLSKYTLGLQTIINKYEQRMDTIREWSDSSKSIIEAESKKPK